MAPNISSMSAEALDKHIAECLKHRATLKPEHPATAPQQVEALVNPAWFIAPVELGTVFQIRHPGAGWLAFVIPPAERAQLLSFLLQHALTPPPVSAVKPTAYALPAGVPTH